MTSSATATEIDDENTIPHAERSYPMYQHLHIPLDSIVIASTTLAASASTIILTSTPDAKELHLLLLPLIGSMIISGGMVMLNPNPETRRIVIGRSIFALFFGALGPSLIGLVHPSIAELSVRPAFLLVLGGIISATVFVLSKPFTRHMYEKAERVAKREVERLESKFSPPMESKTVTVTETKLAHIEPHENDQDRTHSGDS